MAARREPAVRYISNLIFKVKLTERLNRENMVLILVVLLQTIELQGKSLKGPHRTPVRMYGTLNTPWKKYKIIIWF